MISLHCISFTGNRSRRAETGESHPNIYVIHMSCACQWRVSQFNHGRGLHQLDVSQLTARQRSSALTGTRAVWNSLSPAVHDKSLS